MDSRLELILLVKSLAIGLGELFPPLPPVNSVAVEHLERGLSRRMRATVALGMLYQLMFLQFV